MAKKIDSHQVTVVVKSNAEFTVAFLNSVRLRFRKGRATADVEPNKSHKLKWKLRGVPGATWEWRLEPQESFAIDPSKLEKVQKETMQAVTESPPATTFRLVPSEGKDA